MLNYRTVVGDTLSISEMLLSAEKQPIRKQSASGEQNHTFGRLCRGSSRSACIPTDIPILLKTTDLLIVNKPAGIPVHGVHSIDTLLSGAAHLCGNTLQCDTTVQLSPNIPSTVGFARNPLQSLSFKQGPLHRLDKDTTGVLCFSQTLAGAQWFSQCLREKTVGKYYLGVVRGAMPSQLITAEDESGKTITQCYSLSYNKGIDASLILFKLITGKKHQIRKHSASAGHPLVGDRKYRGGNPLPVCKRYLLHAWRLYFPASRPADMPALIEAPFFPEMETCLNRYFSGWEKTASALLINQTQAAGNS
ncbi:RluA family pseudouridine synthase [Treponema medium]|nr:RNA pseudouridine synthase [Treponema medium]